MSFNQARKKISLDKLRKKLADTSEINAIIKQFKAFAPKHNQDWSDIQFVPTHLLAAYTAHPAREYDSEIYETSNFAQVEKFILDKVRADGRFLRTKTFVDSIAVPMCDVVLKIYEHAGNALLESNAYWDKILELKEWHDKFIERCQNRIERLLDSLSKKLDREIDEFAEYHYEDEKVNESWQRSIRKLGLDTAFRNLLQEFAAECDKKRRELSDELTTQLNYSLGGNSSVNIKLEDTTAWGKNISALLPAAVLIPGVGWGLGAAIAAGSLIMNLLSDSKEEKIRQAKQKLKDDLRAPSYKMLLDMYDNAIEVFNKKIVKEGVVDFSNSLSEYQFMLARLGESQTITVRNLCNNFSNLNKYLLEKAVNYRGSGFIDEIAYTARIPGKTFLAFSKHSNVNIKDVSNLLGETLVIMQPKEELPDNVKIVLGCNFDVGCYPLDFNRDGEETEQTISLIPKKKVLDETRFNLAQQIAGVPIIQ